jgi:hypothetical protein
MNMTTRLLKFPPKIWLLYSPSLLVFLEISSDFYNIEVSALEEMPTLWVENS